MSRLYYTVLFYCAVAGAISCGTRGSAESSPATPERTRQQIQRDSWRADEWQFVLCSPSDSLRAYLEALATDQPYGKTVRVVSCEQYRPDRPAIVFGEQLPDRLSGLPEVFPRTTTAASDNRMLVLNNFLSADKRSDSAAHTVSFYLSQQPGEILQHLRTATFSDWRGIFGGRWAYEVHQIDGSRHYGTYAADGWSFSQDEIILPAIGEPLLVDPKTGRQHFSVDGAVDSGRLSRLLLELDLAREDTTSKVYWYPSVERIGLRRGSMSPRQRTGRELHIVVDHPPTPEVSAPPIPAVMRGMTFAHEGYRVYNGYGGSTVAPSLDSLMSLNVNALAIVPYTFMRSAYEVEGLPVPDDVGAENDAAVTYSIRQAHLRDLSVMLKPQIWVGGSWPGAIDFATEAEWGDFFDHYTEWILHYARLAQREQVAALCIGTELVNATLQHPARWKQLIGEIRTIYSGKLTYAANWGREFEQLSFWSDLDVIGLNGYYPLSNKEEPTDADLLVGAKEWMQTADRISLTYDRPLWLTEVGYRSVVRAWVEPHAEVGDRASDLMAQARCYRALLAAASESNRLRGIFIWKWPSYLGYGYRASGGEGYTPGGKPAGKILSDFYGEWSLR